MIHCCRLARPWSLAITLGYGQKIFNPLEAGLNLKFIQRTLMDKSATAEAVDLGLRAEFLDNFQAGFTVQNLGTAVTFISEADPLPLTIRGGLAYVLVTPESDYTLALETAQQGPGSAPRTSLGVEALLFNTLAFRGGYYLNEEINPFAMGMGFREKNLSIDVFYDPLVNFGQSFGGSLTYRFGEGVEFQKKGLLLAPAGLFVQAGKEKISLQWDKVNRGDVVGYNIYFKKPGKSFVKINGKPLTESSVDIKKVPAFASIEYAVSVVVGDGQKRVRFPSG